MIFSDPFNFVLDGYVLGSVRSVGGVYYVWNLRLFLLVNRKFIPFADSVYTVVWSSAVRWWSALVVGPYSIFICQPEIFFPFVDSVGLPLRVGTVGWTNE